MTNWKWQVIIAVPIAAKADADAMAAQVTGTQQDNTFAVMLGPTLSGPVTHCACGTRATDEWVSSMQALLPSANGVAFWRIDKEGILAATNATGAVGAAFGWHDAIASVGLVVVDPLQG
jgi:hypothetical protein